MLITCFEHGVLPLPCQSCGIPTIPTLWFGVVESVCSDCLGDKNLVLAETIKDLEHELTKREESSLQQDVLISEMDSDFKVKDKTIYELQVMITQLEPDACTHISLRKTLEEGMQKAAQALTEKDVALEKAEIRARDFEVDLAELLVTFEKKSQLADNLKQELVDIKSAHRPCNEVAKSIVAERDHAMDLMKAENNVLVMTISALSAALANSHKNEKELLTLIADQDRHISEQKLTICDNEEKIKKFEHECFTKEDFVELEVLLAQEKDRFQTQAEFIADLGAKILDRENIIAKMKKEIGVVSVDVSNRSSALKVMQRAKDETWNKQEFTIAAKTSQIKDQHFLIRERQSEITRLKKECLEQKQAKLEIESSHKDESIKKQAGLIANLEAKARETNGIHCKEVEQLAAELANARNSLREQNFNDLTHKFFSDVTLEGKQPSSSLVALHLAVSAARKENRNKESTCKDRIIWDQRTSVSCKDKIIWDQKAEIKVLSKQVEKLQVKADKWKRKFQGVRS
jgi:hypothetical protein